MKDFNGYKQNCNFKTSNSFLIQHCCDAPFNVSSFFDHFFIRFGLPPLMLMFRMNIKSAKNNVFSKYRWNHKQLLFPKGLNNFLQTQGESDDPDKSFGQQGHQKIKVQTR